MTAEDFDSEYGDFYEYDPYYDLDYDPEPLPVCVICGVDLDWDDYSAVCDDCEAEASATADTHAVQRDAKRAKVTGMQVSGRSIKSVLVPVIEKRGREARRKENRRAS